MRKEIRTNQLQIEKLMEMVFINTSENFSSAAVYNSHALQNKFGNVSAMITATCKGLSLVTGGITVKKVRKLVTIPDQMKADLISLLPRLRRFAITLTRSGPDADDLLQDACASALDKWKQYDTSQPFDRWVFRIVRNSWISETRKRKVRLGQGQVPAEEAPELTVKNTAEDTLAMHDVLGLIAEISEELSQPLMLVCAEGYSYEEVAELLEIPKGTVMSRIYRARKLLASKLGEKEGVVQ